ncbi:Uma2 family endonuclease [Tunicatimonas pelagia]|uniref:Uma2 family endonuclease n=1 Tax=Tunicatimonas pelagia TaxID=931531 RepID=UPI002666E8DA|nr:Uma2 family endonuclease [Tunicatimonas pelagia]WKN41216.1 Uma2 family endonuclease [Tunicatimonas pelagia]
MESTKTVTRITYQEFLNMEIPDDDNYIYELLNGEIVKYSAPESKHQIASANLHLIMGSYVKQKKLGRVLYAPISVFLGEYSAPRPDLLFVSTKKQEIIQQKGVMGTPDLMIEIVSPGSVVRDRVHKKEIYQQAGVPEYWIVDPKYLTVEVYELIDSGYALFQDVEGEGTIESKVIEGLKIDVGDIFGE